MGPFADTHAQNLTSEQLGRFEELLDQSDQDVFEWIIGLAPIPPAFDHDVMHLIRDFRFSAHRAAGADPAA